MNKFKAKSTLGIVLIFLLIVSSFFAEKAKQVKASNSKVITVTFATTPTSPTVTKTPLKYNKNFAFSMEFDDASQDQYENGFKYGYGGTSSLRSESYGGIYYTDGSGRSVALSSRPMLGDMVWNSTNYNNSFADLHTGVGVYTWANLTDMYGKGYDVANHSWSHASALTFPADHVYAYPAPHGSSTIDYDYEISKNNSDILANSGVPAGLGFVPPAGDGGYADHAFTAGYKLFSSESTSFTYSGGTIAPSTTGMDVTSSVDLNHLFAYRYFFSDDRFPTNADTYAFIDTLAAGSTGSTKLWGIGFTHRVGVVTGGSMTWAHYTALMDHISSVYGRSGSDSVWLAPAQEVYEYLGVKQNTVVGTNLVGNVLTITLDTSAVPAGYRRDALSLKVTSNADIASITYAPGEFTAHSENLSTGLINLEWGTVFTANDFTRVETLTATAESTRSQTDIDTATTFANMLPATTEKNNFLTRIGNVVPLGKRYLINLGVSSAAKTQDLVVGSPTYGLYWNDVNVNDSQSVEKVSSVLYDTSNVVSAITVALPTSTHSLNDNLKTASVSMQGAQATTDGTGLYPNSKIQTGLEAYSGSETPAGKIEIRHLDPAKNYKITVFGSTKNANSGNTQGYFTAQGSGSLSTSSLLQFYNNVGTNVSLSSGGTACASSCATYLFSSITPTAGGVITITVYPSGTAWRITPINIIDISEVTAAKPTLSFTSSTLRSQLSGLADFVYNLTDDNSSAIDFPTYQYSSTGAFGGEEHTATPKSSDGSHSGIAGLTSSPAGISHTFVWDAITDIASQEGTFYLRILPHSATQTGSYSLSSGVALDFKNPVQSNISATTTNTTANITWSTQETSRDLIDYGTTTGYGSSVGSLSSGTAVMSHNSGSITSLTACTTYHYRISSRDLVGNNTVSSDQTMHTAGCPDPIASVSAGTYNSTQSVTLSAVGSSFIRYNIDTDYPTDCSAGTLYSTAISVSTSQTIYARACDISNNSTTASFAYTIDTTPPSTPVASPVVGYYNSTQSVTLSASGSDSIRYSISSTPADCSSGTLYSTAISVSTSQTIYTRACDLAGNSSTASFVYTIDTTPPSTPTSSVPDGLYSSTQSVSISASGSDSIRYSTSSIPADCSSGTLYSTAIPVSTSQTIYVRACDLAGNSSTASFVYTIDTTPPSTPVASPIAGLFNTTQNITLSAAGSDSIRYSISGTPVSCASDNLYSTAISVSTSQTIYVRACDLAGNSSTASFAYTIDTTPPSTPVVSPVAGLFNSTQNVSLSASGSDSIRYSTSGTPADCSSGTLYSTAISISTTSTVYARACDLAGNSSTASFVYTIDTTPPSTPVASPGAGLFNSTQNVTLSAAGSDSIRYSTSGTPVSCASDNLYSTAISVSTSQTIYVRACDLAGNSSTASFVYTIDTTAPSSVVAVPDSGLFNTTQSVTLSASGADSIRYSTLSTPADCSSDTLYSAAISVSSTQTIYVRACDLAGNSSTTSFSYTIDTVAPSTPVASPVAGLFNITQDVTLSASGSDSIRYSTSSTPADCSSGTLYSTAISVSTSQTIYTRACDLASNSSTASFAYTIDTTPPSTPASSVPDGLYNSIQSVTLSASGSDSIRYSTSSTPADCSSGALYSTAISVSISQTIYTRACDLAGNSSTASFVYTIDTTPPSTAVASPVVGYYNSTQSVTLSASGSDSIRYSTSSTPTDCSSGTLYSTAISVSTSQTIYVRACDLAGNSSTASFVYTIDTTPPSTPVALPDAGLFGSTQSVTLSAVGSDSIKYSTSSTPADCSSGTLYSTAISVSSTQTIYVRACDLAGNSSTASFAYTIDTTPPSTPVASPGAGPYNSTQDVSLSASGSDSIRYSTSGAPADCSSGTLYSTAISVSISQTIYVRACDLVGNSSTASFSYTIDTVAPSIPVASPEAGSYNSVQPVSLSAVGSDLIRYSMSGIPTDCSSNTLYSTAISVATTSTIYVRACDLAGNSSTASFVYTVDTTPPGTPISNIAAGTYTAEQSVSLSSSGSDFIYYSLSGIPADCSSGTLYSSAISVATTSTVYVRACDLIGNSSTAYFEYTIDPNYVVSTPAAPAPSGGGGGGGGGWYQPVISPIIVPILVIKPLPVVEKTTPSNPTDAVPNVNSSLSKNEVVSIVKNISEVLKSGSVSDSVKILQLFLIKENKGPNAKKLNDNGTTTIFGNLTKQALIEWQKSKGITPDGVFGQKVLSALKNTNEPTAGLEKIKKATVTPTPVKTEKKSPESSTSSVFPVPVSMISSDNIFAPKPSSLIPYISKVLKIGSIGDEVIVLQQFLIRENAGPRAQSLASDGASGIFASPTKQALVEWQKANGVFPDGIFGQQTKNKIKELVK